MDSSTSSTAWIFDEGFETGDPDADFNGDGFMDFFDSADFVFGFENGC